MSFPSNSMNDHRPRESDPVCLILAVVFPNAIIEVPPGLNLDLQWVELVLHILLASVSDFLMDL